MSRLSRYRESISKFIKDRSCLFDETTIPDKVTKTVLYDTVVKTDMLLPILFLTIMNSQNKKNKITMQGYFAASSIQFLFLLTIFEENKDEILQKYGYECYENIKLHCLTSSGKSLFQNLEILKNSVNSDDCVDIINNVVSLYYGLVNGRALLSHSEPEFKDNKVNDEISKWYLKNNVKLKEIVDNIPCLTRESFNKNLSTKLGSIVELTMCAAWLIGGGEKKELNAIRKISGYFTQIYKLYLDFIGLEEDIYGAVKGHTNNYVINYGLQDSYELFMYNKQKFIEECMVKDLFTNTVKEIVSYIENHVDEVVDETSPDLKSNLSTAV